ncbi:MAG: hypothetical protein HY606_15135 [Planctomycetes bacterium]|nr:hypothetical protein [Planctomycetota bacterium]
MRSRLAESGDSINKEKASEMAQRIWNFLVSQAETNDPKTMDYCLNFLCNVTTVLMNSTGAGFTLNRLVVDSALEFYFDVYSGEKDIGYISKGWEDPGLRVGDILNISPDETRKLKENILHLMKACSNQGVAVYFREKDNGIEIELWTPLYIDALTSRGLKDAFDALNECKRMISMIVSFHS